jgi:hypothetical protein
VRRRARRRLVHGCDTAGVAEQYQKFKEAARKLETDQSEEAFDRMLKKVVKSQPPKEDKPKPSE